MSINEKKEVIKKLLKIYKNKRNINSKIFSILKKEIEEMLNDGLSITTITDILNVELELKINTSTLKSWIYRNIKKENNKQKQKGDDYVDKQKTMNKTNINNEVKEEENKEENLSLDAISAKFDIFKN